MSFLSNSFVNERIKFSSTQINVGSKDITETQTKVATWVVNRQKHVIETNSLTPQEQLQISGVSVETRPFLPVVTGWNEKIGFLIPHLAEIHPQNSLQRNLLIGNFRNLNYRLIESLERHELRDPDIIRSVRITLGYENGVSDTDVRKMAVRMLREQLPIPNTDRTWKDVQAAINRGFYCKMLSSLKLSDPKVLQKFNYFLGTIRQPGVLTSQKAGEKIRQINQWIMEGRGEKLIAEIEKQMGQLVQKAVNLFDLSDIEERFHNQWRAVHTSIDVDRSQNDYPIYDPEFDEVRFVPKKTSLAFGQSRKLEEVTMIALERVLLVLKDDPAASEEFSSGAAIGSFLVKLQKLIDRGDVPADHVVVRSIVSLLGIRLLKFPAEERDLGANVVILVASTNQGDLELGNTASQILDETPSFTISLDSLPFEIFSPQLQLLCDEPERIQEECTTLTRIEWYLDEVLKTAKNGKLSDQLKKIAILLASCACKIARDHGPDLFSLPEKETARFLRSLERIKNRIAILDNQLKKNPELKKVYLILSQTVQETVVDCLCAKLNDLMSHPKNALLSSQPKWADRYENLLSAGNPDQEFLALIRENEARITPILFYRLQQIDQQIREHRAPKEVQVKEFRSDNARRNLMIDNLKSLRGAYSRIRGIIGRFPGHLKEPLQFQAIEAAHRSIGNIYRILTYQIGLPEITSSEEEFQQAAKQIDISEALDALRNNYIKGCEDIRALLIQLVHQTVMKDPRKVNPENYQRNIAELAKRLGIDESQCNLYQEIIQLLTGRLGMPLRELIDCTPQEAIRNSLEEVHATIKEIGLFANQVFNP